MCIGKKGEKKCKKLNKKDIYYICFFKRCMVVMEFVA